MNRLVKIPGHSGSRIIIEFDDHHRLFVKKQSNKDRLINQANKQKMFANYCDHDNMTSPVITKDCFLNPESNYEFHMRYIVGLDMISFLSQSSINDIQEFTNILFNYFSKIIHHSKVSKSANNELSKKIKSVRNLLLSNSIIRQHNDFIFLDNLMNEISFEVNNREIILPVGDCHGDLTLSNMMYNPHSKKIVLFDFLDTYFESPVQDMIKIKQDLRHNWTLQKVINKNSIDKKRFEIARCYLDDKIENYFKTFNFYSENYNLLQALNLLRVLVYSKDCTTIKYLLECIKRI